MATSPISWVPLATWAIVLVMTISGANAQSTTPPTLRVGCQGGQAPFNDFGHGGAECHGLFTEIFKHVCDSANITYTITNIDDDNIDALLTPNASLGGNTAFDAFISFHTITPDRLEVIDFSVVVYETGYKMALLPKYHKTAGSIADSVIRESVLYIMSIMGTVIAILSFYFIFWEMRQPESELAQQALWRRILWGYEMAFEVVVTGGTSLDLSHQWSRTMRTLIAMFGFFLVNIFGALITSNLTASALGAATPTIADVRGTNIAVASPTLLAHLNGLPVGAHATDVHNIENFADRWYAGNEPTYDGWAAPTDVTEYVHHHTAGHSAGFTLSTEFFISGSPDLKAFPFAKQVDPAIKRAFNSQLQHVRESGELATLFANLTSASPQSSNDFPVPQGAKTGVFVCVGVVYGVSILISCILWLLKKVANYPAKDFESDHAAVGGANGGGSSGEKDAITPYFEDKGTFDVQWGGHAFRLPPHMRPLIDTIISQSAKTTAVVKTAFDANPDGQ